MTITRRSIVAYNTRSKSPSLLQCLGVIKKKREIVSATQIYNYIMKDPLVDWLKLKNKKRYTRKNHNRKKKSSFTEFIMEKGIEFEKQIVKYINNNIIPVIFVSDTINKSSLEKTKQLMYQGVPIIHSAPVKNQYNNTYGIIDLLVRSDYINDIVEENVINDIETNISSPKLGKPYHYIVIDIKFSTIPLRSDGIHILNSNSYPAYKAQCLIYNEAIGHIQGYTSSYAFILGRRWKYTRKGVNNHNYTCLNRMGRIDYNTVDKDFKSLTKKAIKWVRDLRKNGKKWKINPPSREELYPNMCVDSGEWNKEKEKIAKEISEMTSIWYVGLKHRNNAFKNGIKSWKETRCNTSNMKINGIRAPIIDSIININRQDIYKILPHKISNNLYNWKTKTNEIFVDFETLSDVFTDFNDLPRQDCTDIIFMIGVGYYENNSFIYKTFICNDNTYEEEYRIMKEFIDFTTERKNPKLYHWVAESHFWKKACCRQYDIAVQNENNIKKENIINWDIYENWADLCNIFKSEPIVIKNCFKFGLKPIADSMYKHGLIKTCMKSECNNGMSAMIKAWYSYKNSNDPINSHIMKDIISYNKFDVSVLWEILTYLRNNHT